MTIIDTVFKALAPAIPDRVIAGHHADLVAPSFHGINPKTREFFIGNFGPLGGGWGAKMTEDGVSATVCINDGDTHNGPNEQAEAKFPIVVERFALIPDSGGAGRYRGGLGVERIVRARCADRRSTARSTARIASPGASKAAATATGNEVAFRARRQMEDRLPQRQGAGGAAQDAATPSASRSGGGGGYGDAVRAAGRGRAQRTCGRAMCR